MYFRREITYIRLALLAITATNTLTHIYIYEQNILFTIRICIYKMNYFLGFSKD